tara:strand:- start:911 stop:2539 length:1629 start_codon:yes stop_codon:yes gene_type:complete
MAAEQIIRRFEQLKNNRINWENHWQELADYVLPRKDDIYSTRIHGEKKYNKIFDSTGIHANELLASALHGMLTNPSTQWFELTTGDEVTDQDDDVRLWLQTAVRQMHKILNNSNFQTEIHEVYLDLGSFGTSCMRMEEDDEEVIRFQSRPIYEAYVDQNNKGSIDTVYRSFSWTARQIQQEFGEEALTEDMKQQIEGKLHDRADQYEIIHAVEPLTDKYDGPKLKGKGFAFRSIYVLKEKRKIISYSGFKEFPYLVPRWTKIAGEVYGRSPAMKALADIKMINQVMKTTIRSAQKTVDPPLMMPDDGILLPIKTAPGGINYYRAGSADKIEPLQTGSRVDFGFQMMEQIRMRIREAFFIDQLQLGSGPQMTATEVSQRTEEKLRLLGPILGRQQFELLRPLIDRLFNIMVRKKLFPPAPPVLAEVMLQVRYSSQIAKAQRSADAQSFMRVFEIIGPLFQSKPEMLDNLNGDQLLRYVSRAYGLPEEVLNPLQEVIQQRMARQEQMAMAQQMQQEQHESEVVQKSTPAMKMMQEAVPPEEVAV